MKTGSFFVCLFLVFGTFASKAQNPTKVACVGNSITYGAGISDRANDSYPAHLQKLLGQSYEVLNSGNSGRTLLKNGDYPLWVESEFKAAIEMVPDIVVILLGTNDSKPQNWIYKNEFISDYVAMIDTFRAVNPDARIFACLPPPAFSVQWGIRDSIITTDTIPMIRKIADSTGVDTIDFYNPFIDKNELYPDDIHPNAEGAWEMAKLVYTAITGKTVLHIHDVDVAGEKRVTSYSEDCCSSADALVDGDRSTKWSCMNPGYAIVDLGATESIDLFQTDFGPEGEALGQYYTIQVSLDSSNWITVVDNSVQSDSSLRIAIDAIDPVEARYIKFTPLGPVTAINEAVGAYDFRALRTAPVHAPMIYIDNVDPSSRFTRYEYVSVPSQDEGYFKIVQSTAPDKPFTDIRGYRASEFKRSRGTVRPDDVKRYYTKAYFDGIEVFAADTLTINWSISNIKSDRTFSIPNAYQLDQNYPNPFNPTTTIPFTTPSNADIEIEIYSALGEIVRTWKRTIDTAGIHSIVWDGLDDRRISVASGLYYYRLQVNGQVVETKRMVLLR